MVANRIRVLTIEPSEPFGPLLLRQVYAEVVHRYTGQCDSYSYEGIDCVTIQGHDDQEQTAQAINERDEQRQLKERKQKRQGRSSIKWNHEP